MTKQNTRHRQSTDAVPDVAFRVSDEDYAELEQLVGEEVVRVVVWEDSVIDALADAELTDPTSDIDVYLGNGVRFELYAVLCYPSLEDAPLVSGDELRARFDVLARTGLHLEDVAVDAEDDLVLVVSSLEATLYLNVGAWTLEEWEELPE